MITGITGNKLHFQSVFAGFSTSIKETCNLADIRAKIGQKMEEISVERLKAKITELSSSATVASIQERLAPWFDSFGPKSQAKLSAEERAALKLFEAPERQYDILV